MLNTLKKSSFFFIILSSSCKTELFLQPLLATKSSSAHFHTETFDSCKVIVKVFTAVGYPKPAPETIVTEI